LKGSTKGQKSKLTVSGNIVRCKNWIFLKNFSSNGGDSQRDGTPMANGFLAYLFSGGFFVILGNKEI